MKKPLAITAVVGLALTLTACGKDGADTSSPSPAVSTTPATSTSMSVPSPTPATAEKPSVTISPAVGSYPAQADMTQLGPNADRVNAFQDTRGKFWICDKATPHGNPEVEMYNTPNGCAGPYATEEETVLGLYREIHDGLAEEFGVESNFDDYLTPTPPTPRNEGDIAAGIAESMGCESAVFNEDLQGYEYVGCP